MANILKNIAQSEILNLKDCVAYADGQVVSKTLIQNDGVGITIAERNFEFERMRCIRGRGGWRW